MSNQVSLHLVHMCSQTEHRPHIISASPALPGYRLKWDIIQKGVFVCADIFFCPYCGARLPETAPLLVPPPEARV